EKETYIRLYLAENCQLWHRRFVIIAEWAELSAQQQEREVNRWTYKFVSPETLF
ncbi:unnamed protein product, partial [Brassica oleracea]